MLAAFGALTQVNTWISPPKFHNNRAGRQGYFQYITNNALQIGQNGGYLLSSMTFLHCCFTKKTMTVTRHKMQHPIMIPVP